jgi:diguanylate cyclase (GGDEF)-like protein
VTDAFRGRGVGVDPIVAISAPLKNSSGEFVGIIEGSLDLGAFARIERQRKAMDGASVILLDPQDRVIFASASAMLAPLEKMTSAPFHVAGRSAADATFSYEAAGTAAQYLAAVATTRDGWRAYVTVPVTAIREQILTDYRTSALTILLSIAAAALLVTAIVRRVMFSIEDMNSAMTRFRLDGTGPTIRTPLSTFSEFKPVYAEMRQRAEALKRAYQHLRDSQAAGDRLRSELDREVTEREHEIEKRTAELREAHDRLADLSKLDPLTGIANRREFEAFRDRVLRLATRDDLSIAIVLVDVDYFKIYNDRLGHQAGDECLKTVAKTLSQCAARPLDLVARYGGEEFVAVLGGSTVMDALVVADRMRRAVEALAIEHPASSQDRVSVSCGVAAGRPRDGANPEEMLGAADEALYYAKAAGRNCVVFQKDGEFVTFDNDEIDLGETNVLSILAARRR